MTPRKGSFQVEWPRSSEEILPSHVLPVLGEPNTQAMFSGWMPDVPAATGAFDSSLAGRSR